ncbi:putative peroxidase [Helianthus annuus]|nr:putative peroxidase [Helianthus annuus]
MWWPSLGAHYRGEPLLLLRLASLPHPRPHHGKNLCPWAQRGLSHQHHRCHHCLDIYSPIKFDNKYFVDLMNRQGLFTSDQDLYTHKVTKPIVESFAHDEKLFFEAFVKAMIKMGQMEVLTGGKGEIRAHCSIRNPDNKAYFSYLVEEEDQSDLETRAELR